MKRSVKHSFIVIFVLISLLANVLNFTPVGAVGTSMDIVNLSLPTGWSYGYLSGVWGSSSSDVYAVGYGYNGSVILPLVYHKSGSNWVSSSPTLPVGWSDGVLNGIWGSSASDIYAVGSNNDTSRPLLIHWNGSAWASSSPGLPTGWTHGVLSSVWGSGASDVYAIGYGYSGTAFLPLIYHWNGSAWGTASLTLPTGWTSGNLYAIWGSGASDVYALGSGNNGTAMMPLIYHWNGSSWTLSNPLLPIGWTSGNLKGIWGSASNNIYAVGSGYNGSVNIPLLYQWNGSTWIYIPLPLPAGVTPGYLSSVWGSASSDVYIVGYGYQGTTIVPLLYHRDSNGWSEASPTLPNGWRSDFLYTVWGSSFSDVYAVGSGNNGSVDMPLLYHSSSIGQDVTPPGDVTNLTATTGTTNGTVKLSWTAPADDSGNNLSGSVASYLVKYSTSPFTSWTDGTPVTTGLPIPTAPGTTQTMTVSGLNPGTLYYFAVRAQDEQYNLSINYATANATAKSPPPVGGGTYDDMSSAWTYSGSWQSYNSTGPYNNTLHYTNVQNVSASITFTGTQFTVYFTKYPNRGNVEVWIDGTLQYTFSENASSLAWQQSWTLPTALSNGTHTVQFKNPNANTATYIDIDYIVIVGPVVPVGPGIYDDTESAWTYAGNWTSYSGAGPYNNTLHYTNVQNASASITFTGTQFTLYFTLYSNRGNVEVWIDGAKQYTFSENSSSLVWQQSWALPTPLSNGTHTVQFKNPSADTATYIDIDAITIVGPAQPVDPGTYDDTNSAWSYSGSWTSYSGAGPYNNTLHYTNVQNASASITFTGEEFTVYFTLYPNRGNVDVWIDGAKQYTFNENGSSLAWQQSWTLPTPLSNGTHTVEFKNPTAGTSTYIDIDAITITAAVSPGSYDDGDAAWSYAGNWTNYSSSGPYNNTLHYTNMQNASASLTFTGTQFTVYFTKYPNRGNMDVWIDGTQQYTINENGSSLAWQQSWALPASLSPGTHTVQFKNPSADTAVYVDIDAIQILP